MPRPRQRKIDPSKLQEMLDEGKTMTECAKVFQCSIACISKEARRIRLGTTFVANLEAGAQAFKKQINTFQQMLKINEKANFVLDGLMKEIEDGNAAREKQKDLREIALKATAEIREQLKLQTDIMKTLHDVASVAEFQKEVLAVIGEANKCPACAEEIFCKACGVKVDLRSLIIARLKEARALRSGVTFRP